MELTEAGHRPCLTLLSDFPVAGTPSPAQDQVLAASRCRTVERIWMRRKGLPASTLFQGKAD